jgi:acyl-CoA thioester hydrolase
MSLSIDTELNIRFSDTDAMGVVWHGNYLRFFEDGREDFGKKFGIEYLDMYNSGYFTPIVKSEISHKSPIYYGDKVKVVTNFIPQRAAKLVFEYQIINIESGKVCAEGKTIQVFLSVVERQLELSAPQFFVDWRNKNLKK